MTQTPAATPAPSTAEEVIFKTLNIGKYNYFIFAFVLYKSHSNSGNRFRNRNSRKWFQQFISRSG